VTISSLSSLPGSYSIIFWPLVTTIFSAQETRSQTPLPEIVDLAALTSSSICKLLSVKTVPAFLQETQPFRKYAQSIFTLLPPIRDLIRTFDKDNLLKYLSDK
jgi:hypothetical protein